MFNVRLHNLPPVSYLGLLLLGLALGNPAARAGEYGKEYKDIYLTENRVCKACRWEAVDNQSIRLTNRNGDRIVVHPGEVLGMDRHPVWRKMIYKSLVGVGLPGKIIVPGAFEDGRDFACKYCDP
ncbi:hypothetical protein [Vampirovibrio chlorellavorus]|uniref:hypothetical protein n=1 Tax=Vampirovibrio chlorellavorus TaxID=758823 RepID=UPI0026ED8494|nr:hypothetical protein [Vampirovibrio chlorellavorus]